MERLRQRINAGARNPGKDRFSSGVGLGLTLDQQQDRGVIRF
jgi:hypothetical protein